MGPERLRRDKTQNCGPHGAAPIRHQNHGIHEALKSELRYKVVIRFAVQDDTRFISHHDTMRMFERALARTDLPVRFSEGFNPRPKLSLPLPRPVGIATTVDLLAIELAEPVAPEEALRQLAEQMPHGVTLSEAWVPPGRRAMQPESATYVLDLPAEAVRRVSEQIETIANASGWPVQRVDNASGHGKELDLKSYLLGAAVEGTQLSWTTRVTGGGSIRPAEFLAAVGLDPAEWQHRVYRTGIVWQVPADSSPDAHPTDSLPTDSVDG